MRRLNALFSLQKRVADKRSQTDDKLIEALKDVTPRSARWYRFSSDAFSDDAGQKSA